MSTTARQEEAQDVLLMAMSKMRLAEAVIASVLSFGSDRRAVFESTVEVDPATERWNCR